MVKMDTQDLVSKQMAMDALEQGFKDVTNGIDKLSPTYGLTKAVTGIYKCLIGKLPPVQPEILACGEGELNVQSDPRWIPVTERLPEKEGFYLVTLEHKYGDETNIRFFKNYETNIRFFKCESGERYWSKWGNETITAWMPLPEPYKEVIG